MRSIFGLALAFSVAVDAFYPYQLPTSLPSPAQPGRVKPRTDSISFPLRRVALKRANTHQIIKADKPSAADSAGVNQDGFDNVYMIELGFGTSKKKINLLLDTAAVNTWVMSSDCKSQTCASHITYGSADSTTLKFESRAFAITYGSGNVAGTVVTDSVNVLDKTLSLTFGLASNVSNEFSSYSMDGIAGFGRVNKVVSNPTGVGAPTLMDALVSQGVIKSNLFGIKLSRASDGAKDGVINFGKPDSSAYDGDLNWITVTANDRGFWEIPIDNVKYDGKTASIQSGVTVILDSGTSFMLLPHPDAQALHDLIDGSAKDGPDAFTVPCSTSKTLSFAFGGKSYSISPKDYVGDVISDQTCSSNIVGRTTFSNTQWLVGDVFLKNVYSVYDADGSRVGLAPTLGSPRDATTSAPKSAASSGGARSPVLPGSTAAANESGSSGNRTLTTATGLASGLAVPRLGVTAACVAALLALQLVI